MNWIFIGSRETETSPKQLSLVTTCLPPVVSGLQDACENPCCLQHGKDLARVVVFLHSFSLTFWRLCLHWMLTNTSVSQVSVIRPMEWNESDINVFPSLLRNTPYACLLTSCHLLGRLSQGHCALLQTTQRTGLWSHFLLSSSLPLPFQLPPFPLHLSF